jgi:flagellar motor switch protein FliN/FliY
MGFMATSMSEMFARRIDISPPRIERRDLGEETLILGDLNEEDEVVQVAFRISVADLIDSSLIQLIPLEAAKKMALYLLGEESAAPAGDEHLIAAAAPEAGEEQLGVGLEEAPLRGEESPLPGEREIDSFVLAEEEPPPLPHLGKAPQDGQTLEKLNLVKDLPIDITVILSRARVPLGKLFALGKGDVLDLDGHVGDPVELLVNGKLVAYGEVVLVNEYLGVRISRMQLDAVPE